MTEHNPYILELYLTFLFSRQFINLIRYIHNWIDFYRFLHSCNSWITLQIIKIIFSKLDSKLIFFTVLNFETRLKVKTSCCLFLNILYHLKKYFSPLHSIITAFAFYFLTKFWLNCSCRTNNPLKELITIQKRVNHS